MAKKSNFKTTYSSVKSYSQSHDVDGMRVSVTDYTTTKEVTPKTFRQSETGIFNLVTSLSTYIIVMVIIVLAGTTTYYIENKENLSWIDENGEFVETSYIRDNNSSISNLNGYSLNAIFRDGNLLSNYNFDTGIPPWSGARSTRTLVNGALKVQSNLSASFYQVYQWSSDWTAPAPTSTTYYARADFIDLVSTTAIHIQVYDGSYPTIVYNFNVTGSAVFTHSQQIIRYMYTAYSPNQLDPSSFVMDNNYLIDLEAFNIHHLSASEMDIYYDVYLSNNENSFKELGSIPVSNYETLGQVITSVVDTMDAFLSGWIDFYETILSIF